MKPTQLIMRLRDGVQMECLNNKCFHVGVLIKPSEADYKHVWNSQIEDLDMIPICASCQDPLVFWESENGT